MEARQLKWYLKKMAKEKGITEEEYFNNYYKNYNKENKTKDIKAYRNEYYKEHKDTWEKKYLNLGNYVYFIVDAENSEILYVGSTNSIKRRIARHKSKEKIKQFDEEGINCRVFYLELPNNWSRDDREIVESCYIDKFKTRYNEKAKDFNNPRTLELLKEVDVRELKEYKI